MTCPQPKWRDLFLYGRQVTPNSVTGTTVNDFHGLRYDLPQYMRKVHAIKIKGYHDSGVTLGNGASGFKTVRCREIGDTLLSNDVSIQGLCIIQARVPEAPAVYDHGSGLAHIVISPPQHFPSLTFEIIDTASGNAETSTGLGLALQILVEET